MTETCVAVIPARGGSKGVPRKNLRTLAGQPLLAHIIGAARAARRVSRVLVSTDDDEIARVATTYGADVVRRPAVISGDTAASELAVLHALETYRPGGNMPALTAFLQATSPLTLPEDIDGAIETLRAAHADACFTAMPFTHFLWREEGGSAVGINHDPRRRQMRQQMAPQYLENGAVYVMRSEGFLEARHRFFGKTVIHVMPGERCLEIDSVEDFARADAAFRVRAQQRRATLPPHPAAVVFDFDGVFTDNGVYVGEDGTESVRCDRGDGLGLEMLKAAGVPVVVLSKETNPVVAARCRKLRLEHLVGIHDKLPVLRRWCSERSIALADTVYVGNDANDVACMKAVGGAVCPADAHETARQAAGIVLSSPGGRGAVREVCDMIVARLSAVPLSGGQP